MNEYTSIIIDELKTLSSFQRSVFRQLLKKTEKMIYSLDFDKHLIYFKLEGKNRVLFEKKFSFKQTLEKKNAEGLEIKQTGTNLYEFERNDIEEIIKQLK